MQLYKTKFTMKSESAATSPLLKGAIATGLLNTFINLIQISSRKCSYFSVDKITNSEHAIFRGGALRKAFMAELAFKITYLFSTSL